MQVGTIAKLISDKGFGFIKVEGREKDLFFHTKDVAGGAFDSFREGDKVSFDIDETGPKGPAAVNVVKA